MLFKASSQRRLGVEDWARVFREANELGVSYLDVSGGEPTIYPELERLIWEAKKLGWYTSLNSTGFQMAKIIEAMERVGLDKVCVSLMSLDRSLNNEIRGGKDTYSETMDGIDALSKSKIDLALHFIVSRLNFREFPDVVDFAFDKRAASLACVYPENDHEERFLLMNNADIQEFLTNIVPSASERYRKRRAHNEEFPALFDGHGSGADFSKGKYWKNHQQVTDACDKPLNFLLIYPNGDVLPCNGIEYTHQPIIGNVLEKSLSEIWFGDLMERFRDERISYCINCPIKKHSGVSISRATIPPYSEPAIKKIPNSMPPMPATKIDSWSTLKEFPSG